MAYLKQNVNFVLLIFIMITCVIIMGSAVYYHTTQRGLAIKYNTASSQLEDMNKTLTKHVRSLSNVQIELSEKQKRESELSGQFSEVKTIKEQLESDNAELKSGLVDAQRELGSLRAEATNLRKDNDALRTAVTSLNNDLSTCDALKKEYKKSMEEYKDRYEDCSAST